MNTEVVSSSSSSSSSSGSPSSCNSLSSASKKILKPNKYGNQQPPPPFPAKKKSQKSLNLHHRQGSKRGQNKTSLLTEQFSGFETPDAHELLTASPNKRGHISLTHLLNFSFPPRQSHSSSSFGKKRTSYSSSYNKEKFVNSNYRFVVKEVDQHGEKIDYSVFMVDPDQILEWENIDQVLIPTNHEINCPICLHAPTAARVTKCGHVYCWTCIEHYLSLKTETKPTKWKKCPICFDAIYANDLKSVRFLMTTSLSSLKRRASDGSEIVLKPSVENRLALKMTLMKRALHSTVCLPRVWYHSWSTDPSETSHLPVVTNVHAFPYSRLLLSSPEYYRDEILTRDMLELEVYLNDLIENSGFCEDDREFAKSCIGKIKDELNRLDSSSIDHQSAAKSYGGRKKAKSPVSKSPELDLYYFYQSSDGQFLFLHPLDIKILKHEFGEYSQFPDKIDVDVIYISESTLDQDLRKRCKWLEHLPLGCDVGFIEVDWTGIVSPATLAVFSHEISSRIEKHQIKERKEDQEKRRGMARQDQINRELGLVYQRRPSITIDLDEQENFPSIEGSSPPTGNPSPSSWQGPSFAHIASTPSSATKFRILYSADSANDFADEDGGKLMNDNGWVLDLGGFEDKNTDSRERVDIEKAKQLSLNLGKKKGKKKVVVVSNESARRRY